MMEELFEEPCKAYYQIFTDKPDETYKYNYISPFEFTSVLIDRANKSVGEKNVLNAGRDNPNFYSTMPRYMFAQLIQICTRLGDELCEYNDTGYIPHKKGIAKRFNKLLDKVTGSDGKNLRNVCNKMRTLSGMDKDTFTHNLVISTIGCNYPEPPRVQKFVEPILADFFDKNIYKSKNPLKGKVKIMPTEGSAAAIIYVFDSLKYNGLVIPGDTIGIMTPIFSPYMEIPSLQNYNLNQVCIKADKNNNWEIPDEEIEKIGDPNMKALFLVNPTNPTSLSLSASTVRKIASVVRNKNPNLIILEDNVYAPYVKEFNNFFNVLPRNTIGVFSFSKYFGVTGWRLGSIIIQNNNIIDSKLLKQAPESVHKRYNMITTKSEKMSFIDRILADSRQVAEANFAGLSTPQQTLMTLFATYDLLDKERIYNINLDNILLERMNDLLEPIEYEVNKSTLNSNYYVVIDIINVANRLLGDTSFGEYLQTNRDPLEFLLKLAKDYGTVLLPAVGFAGPFWSVRVSLANLPTEDYAFIGENLRNLIDDYYEEFKIWDKKNQRKKEKEGRKKNRAV